MEELISKELAPIRFRFLNDEVDKKSIFGCSANHKTKVIASVQRRAMRSKKKWVKL